MKKLFSLIIAVLITVVTFAQSQIATLSHAGEITTFYGADAFKSAYDKSENGDVITLSSGSFNAVADIAKLITIKGAGMGVKVDNESIYLDPTVLIGNFTITADGNSDNHLTLDGICNENRVTLRGINLSQFVKCRFYDVDFSANHGALTNGTFIHCYISNSFDALYNTSVSMVASCIKGASFYGQGSLFTLTNCIIETSNPNSDLQYTSLKNCIIVNVGSDNNAYTDNTSIYNSVWVGSCRENPFGNTEHYNSVFPQNNQIFVEDTFYKLTEEGKKYLGSDNTEVGIYGGNLPFDPTPSGPQITKFNVASKTTADGKLSVDVEVE